MRALHRRRLFTSLFFTSPRSFSFIHIAQMNCCFSSEMRKLSFVICLLVLFFFVHIVCLRFSLFVWLSGDPSDCQERLTTSSSNVRAAAALILIWIVYESIYLNPPFYPPRKLNSSSHSRVWKGGGNELQSKKSEIKKKIINERMTIIKVKRAEMIQL